MSGRRSISTIGIAELNADDHLRWPGSVEFL